PRHDSIVFFGLLLSLARIKKVVEWRARKNEFREAPQAVRGIRSSAAKISLSFFPKLWFTSVIPTHMRGGRVVTNARRDAVDADGVARRAAFFCGRRSRVVPAPRCRCQASRIL